MANDLGDLDRAEGGPPPAEAARGRNRPPTPALLTLARLHRATTPGCRHAPNPGNRGHGGPVPHHERPGGLAPRLCVSDMID
jgi:hypothetical protein